jgi:Arylsulfotransferase (ASST)/Secretion system C-terminal sorting domain
MTLMRKNLILLALLLTSIICTKAQTTVGLLQHDAGTLDDGYVLFAPNNSNTTYLIDKCGKQVKTWPSTYRPGQSCYILPDGTLLRPGNTNNATFNAGGRGGIIQKIDWNGNVTWSYTVSDATKCQHHDIKALPNGNVLVIAWESKTNTEAIAQGRNPSLTTATVWSEQILEIQPVGATGGNVVWEWHLWDHLVQDYDNTKPNYGIVATSPQLINLNFNASANATNNFGQDWIHLNSVDYNAALDQVLLSSHSFDEIWVIDHSTTTAQAATHTGGNSGKGGDVLYRWGNPRAYSNGATTDQKLFGQHNAYWIEPGFPYQNQIMIFNNGNGRIGGNYSTVEIINPPVNGYNYTATLPYLPTTTSWMYNTGNPNNMYAQNISGSQQLSNGNMLYCNGPVGTFAEVNAAGTTLWKYVNPVATSGVLAQGATPAQNLVFRCNFYASNYSGFTGKTLTPGSTIENTNTNSNACTVVIPVKLSGFEGKTDRQNTALYWQTETEINSSHFIVERSTDGLSFVNAGRVNAAGNTSQISRYSYTDYNVPTGRLYYRLKQVDADGRFEYSNIIMLQNGKNGFAFTVLPNPATGSLVTIQYNGLLAYDTEIGLYSTDGKLVKQTFLKKGQTTVILNIESLHAGTYIVKIQNSGALESHKVIIVK